MAVEERIASQRGMEMRRLLVIVSDRVAVAFCDSGVGLEESLNKDLLQSTTAHVILFLRFGSVGSRQHTTIEIVI